MSSLFKKPYKFFSYFFVGHKNYPGYVLGVFLEKNLLIISRTNLTTDKTIARIKKSHISQMVTLNIRPIKKRLRNIIINVSKIPIGWLERVELSSAGPQPAVLTVTP